MFYSCTLSGDVSFGQEQGKIKRKKVPKPRHSTLGCGFTGFWAVARGFLGCPSLGYRVATVWFPYLYLLHAVLCSCTTFTDFKVAPPPGEPQLVTPGSFCVALLTHRNLSTSAAHGPRLPETRVVPRAANTKLLLFGGVVFS